MATSKAIVTKTARKKAAAHAKGIKKKGERRFSKASNNKAGAKKRRPSALDAAARVLAESGRPLNAMQMIEAMAKKGYWTSPAGKTPERTLYAAVLRELKTKGKEARFKKAEPGKFILATTTTA